MLEFARLTGIRVASTPKWEANFSNQIFKSPIARVITSLSSIWLHPNLDLKDFSDHTVNFTLLKITLHNLQKHNYKVTLTRCS
jgi:hypothetical protein